MFAVVDKYTVYSDPISGNEVLVIGCELGNYGVVYNPRKTDVPFPWHQKCPHCMRGTQTGLSLQTKRMVQLLCTESSLDDNTTAFHVPSNSDPFLLELQRKEGKTVHIKVVRQDSSSEPFVVTTNGKKIEFSKNKREYQSPILSRAIKILCGSRSIDKVQLLRILNEMILLQKKNGLPIGNHRPCKKINWFSVFGE